MLSIVTSILLILLFIPVLYVLYKLFFGLKNSDTLKAIAGSTDSIGRVAQNEIKIQREKLVRTEGRQVMRLVEETNKTDLFLEKNNLKRNADGSIKALPTARKKAVEE